MDGSSFSFCSPPLERLRAALVEKDASPLDLAVLIRHSLIYQTAARGGSPPAVLKVPVTNGLPGESEWRRTGIVAFQRRDGFADVEATSWTPVWLSPSDQPDMTASSEIERRSFEDDPIPGDPFLLKNGLQFYRSYGQAHAVRSALSMPPGATLLVCLATGEGKSLVFKLIDAVGFGDAGSEGVTVVVVPTVTLALDHENSCVGEKGGEWRAYVGGLHNALKNQKILERVENGTQGLCFASPEAVCGPMRRALLNSAQIGRLRALVIDEAHLIDSWGTEFRPHFQVLSGLRRELLQACPDRALLRTVLLSATITQNTLSTIKVLFGSPGPFGISSSLSLRPEIEFWVAKRTRDDEEREERVLDAVLHAPRPAIVYVSRVADAIHLYEKLRREGFRRLSLIHGSISDQDKNVALEQWKKGKLDLVVATSAFGLGIDYPHTRAVIHACIPETLDRFYQEAGRAGRDGRACMSLILPSFFDDSAAKALNSELVIGIERGRQRWLSMFHHADRQALGKSRFLLRIDVPPGQNEKDIDMVGTKSTAWSAKTLTLMARSGLIRLIGIPPKIDYDILNPNGIYQGVEVLDSEHPLESCWQQKVEPSRKKLWLANEANLASMLSFLETNTCPAKLLKQIYTIEMDSRTYPVAARCGGCPVCRRSSDCDPPKEPAPCSPWPWPASGPLHPAIDSLIDGQGRLVVYYGTQSGLLSVRRLKSLLKGLYGCGFRNLVLLGGDLPDSNQVLSFAEDLPFFVSRPRFLSAAGLPPGPEILFICNTMKIMPDHIAPREARCERILLVQEDVEAHWRTGVQFREIHNGGEIPFSEFYRRIVQ